MRGRSRLRVLIGIVLALPARAAVEIATVDTPGSVNDLVLAGSLGYLADAAEGIRVYDLTNPAAPVEIGSLAPVSLGNVKSLALDGDRLYAAENLGGMSIVDVSDPANPVRLGSITGFSIAEDVAVIGFHAFVISSVGPGF